jgi:hypothetical protein
LRVCLQAGSRACVLLTLANLLCVGSDLWLRSRGFSSLPDRSRSDAPPMCLARRSVDAYVSTSVEDQQCSGDEHLDPRHDAADRTERTADGLTSRDDSSRPCGSESLFSRCHLCWRSEQPRSNPWELFRHQSPVRVSAPHHIGAWNMKYPSAASDRVRITARPRLWRTNPAIAMTTAR